ncbi:helix-turn-helix domain-containing protein, partial [Thiolapillus sp.]
QGSSQKKLAAQAGLSEASLSRMKSLEDVRLSSLIKLAEAAGLRLTLVPDDDLAEQIIRGDLL